MRTGVRPSPVSSKCRPVVRLRATSLGRPRPGAGQRSNPPWREPSVSSQVVPGRRDALPPGALLGDGGRYEVRRRIGQGAMAEVYRGVDRRLNNRIVAVKVMSSSVADHAFSEKMRALFIEEARALSRIRDDNVVAVLDSGAATDGTPFMVMEFLNGQDLAGLLKEQRQLPVKRTVDIMLAVCAGVHACHLAGIIHRDLKPANIFLERTAKGEQPKVLDFSVAKIPVSRDEARTDLVVGTPSYMSPEQALGRPADERSDQYSIGALLHRCLVGKPPRAISGRPRDVQPEIPEALEAIVMRALDSTPANRYQSVHALGHSLLPFASAIGRLRWTSYYATPPRPVPATVGQSTASGPIADLAAATTTRLAPYDFELHERTTNAVAPPEIADPDRREEAADEGPPTQAAVPVPVVVGGVSSALASPAGIDLDREPSRSNGPRRSSVSSHPAPSRSSRMVVPAAIAGLAVVLGALAVVRLSRDRHSFPPPPTPPAWTRLEVAPKVDSSHAGSAPTPTIPQATQAEPGLKPVTPSSSEGPPAPVSEKASGPSGVGTSDDLAGNAATASAKANDTETPRRPHSGAGKIERGDHHRRRTTGAATNLEGGARGDWLRYPAVGGTSQSKYPAVPD